jgi:hypothetical protein
MEAAKRGGVKKKEPGPLRGDCYKTRDGRIVTILEKFGNAYKVLNEVGRMEVIYPDQLAPKTSNH